MLILQANEDIVMKLFLRIQLLLFLLLSLSTSYSFAKNPRTEIRKVLEKQQSAWNNGDLTEFMQGYWHSDSLVFIGKNGPKYGWSTTLNNYKNSYPDRASMGVLTFGILKVDQINSTAAFVVGSWKLDRAKGELSGYFSLLFRKINGNWVIVADHSS